MTASKTKPPQAPRADYITPAGALRLRTELDWLWRVQRPQVTQAVSEAAAQGDRSENAEYIYGKKQLREIDRRIRFLTKRLEELVVVDRLPGDTSRVFFGAWVRLESEQGEECVYRIVGADEIEPERGLISINSPLAQALLKKTLDDVVAVESPQGLAVYTLIEISYREFAADDNA
jgi:transcription elongation factor GreB